MKNAWKSVGVGAALIVLLTVAVYLPALRAGFVFDDRGLITENRMVQAGDGPYRFWFTAETADYRPLTWSLWWLEWRLWDGRATGYHVVNVLLHAINAVLVWVILRRLRIPGAWLTALVFAIHPVNVATVAWISEQKNTLSMLFCALAILLYLKFDEGEGWRWYGLSVAAFLLALLSKTAVVMFPLVLLGCAWRQRGRVRRQDWLCSVPYFVGSVVLAVVTIVQHHRALGGTQVRTGGFAARLAGAGWVPWFYLSKALLPVKLTVIYPKWEVDSSRWMAYLPGIILLGVFVVFWWRRERWGRPLLLGLGYFLVMLFPVLGFFDQGFYYYTLVADHWQYYSIIGVIALVVGAVLKVGDRIGEQRRYLGMAAGVAVLVVLGVATWKRESVYADEEALWRDNVAKNPNASVPHYNWAVSLAQAGRTEDAIVQYQEALRLKPDFAEAHNNLGAALVRQGQVQEAVEHYEQALRYKPDDVEAYNNLGEVSMRCGRVPEAIRYYGEALRINPDYAEAHYNLGNTFHGIGRAAEAIRQYEQALRVRPDYAEAHNNLGIALAQAGRVPEAIGHYEQALRIKPDYAEAHYNIGNSLLRAGRIDDAIGHYERALRIKSDNADGHNNLGIALAQVGKTEDAIAHYQEALRLKPDFAEAHNSLGAALIRLGRVQEAVEHYEQVLRLKPDYAEARNNLAWLLAALPAAQGGDPVRALTLAQQACEMTGNRATAYLDTLAVAYAAVGRFTDAMATAQKAIQLAESAAQPHLAREIDARLQLYRAGNAYRLPPNPRSVESTAVTSPHNP